MKQLLERIIKRRNPQFKFDSNLNNAALYQFIAQTGVSMLRGYITLLYGRKSKFAMFGKRVKLVNVPKIRWGKLLKVGHYVTISAIGSEGVSLGNNVSLGDFSKLVVSTTLDNIGKGIHIGNNVGIGEYAYLGGAGGLTIGDDCIVGQYLSCHPENHNYEQTDIPIRHQGVSRKGIKIGSNCWIGSKVTILDGVVLGSGCIIAAGSVVTKSFPENSIIGGVPAKILKSRES